VEWGVTFDVLMSAASQAFRTCLLENAIDPKLRDCVQDTPQNLVIPTQVKDSSIQY